MAPPTTTNNGILTPATNAPTPNSDSSSSSDDIIDLPPHESYPMFGFAEAPVDEDVENFESLYALEQVGVPSTLRPNVDELATIYFFNQFTSQNGHWTWLRDQARFSNMDPVLELAIRACGIASFDNVQRISQGREYSRKLYGEALGLLNSALRDPKRSKTDDSLVAVAMLGYYEVSRPNKYSRLLADVPRTSLVTAETRYCHGKHTSKERPSCSNYEERINSRRR